MRRRVLLLVVLAVLAVCNKGGDRPPSRADDHAPATAGPARPQPALKVTVDGKPIAMQSAFIWRAGDTDRLWVSSVPSSCAHATAKTQAISEGEQSFDATLGRRLEKDGSFTWAVRQVSYGGRTRVGRIGATQLTGDAAPGASTRLTLKLEVSSMAFGGEPEHRLAVEGTVDALGCPSPAAGGPAAAPPPAQAATMTIAGHEVPVAGAVIEAEPSGERTIVLSSGKASCEGFAHGEGSTIELTLHYRKDGDEVWQADLMGDWIDGQHVTQAFDKGKLVVAPARIPAGATRVELALSGATDIQGYAVALAGKATAQACAGK